MVINSQSSVFGNAVAAGQIFRQAGSYVQQQELSSARVAEHSLDWDLSFPPVTHGDIRIEPWQSPLAVASGSYGVVELKSGIEVTLTAGVYHVQRLQLEPGSSLYIDDSAGPVLICVEDSFTFRGEIAHSAQISPDLFIGYFGTGAAYLDTTFDGDLIAPSARVVLGGQGTHEGRFFAHELEVCSGASVSYRLPGELLN